MNDRVEIKGLPELQEAFRNLSKEGKRRVGLVVQATGIEIRGDIVKRIQRGPATGRVYTKSNPARTHQASAAGEAPATDTGRLASSIDYKREGQLSASVGSELAYAAMLEFGTAKIDPRPAWVPAVEKARPKYIERLEKAMREAAK